MDQCTEDTPFISSRGPAAGGDIGSAVLHAGRGADWAAARPPLVPGRALNTSRVQHHTSVQGAGANKAAMQLDGAAEGCAPGASCPAAAQGPGIDLGSLAQQVANLTQALAASHHPAHAAAAAAPRAGFWAGAIFTLLLLGLVGALAAYRFRYSLRRLSKRHEQRQVLRHLNNMDPAELRRLLGDASLPAWVNFPDYQRVGWLTTVMAQLYPYAAKYTQTWIEDNVPQMLEDNKPSWMRSIKLSHVSLGPVSPEPTAVKVYSEAESRSDEIILEIDFTWAGQQTMVFVVKPVPKAATHAATRLPIVDQIVDMVSNIVIIKTAIERFTLSGRLRVSLRPLMNQLPLIGSAQVSFTELPRFSFDLTLFGGDASLLPGLEAWLHGLIKDSVLRPLVLPEKMVIPLADQASPDFERPRALLQVTVIEGEHVPRMDIFTASDPYVELSVRERQKVRTQVVDNSKHPSWQEEFSLIVHYPETQVLQAKLFDYDTLDRDDEIGRVEIPVKDLPRDKALDDWFTVEPPHQDKPSSNKYMQAGGPLNAASHAAQKAVGLLIRPWETAELLKPGRSARHLHKPCRLHLKLRLHEFAQEDLDAAVAAHWDSAADLSRLSVEARKALRGGLLSLRVLRVEGITPNSLLLGGWKRSIQVRAWLAGIQKQTSSVKGKRSAGQITVDQELEFVVDGDRAAQPHDIRLEVWDTRWRDEFKGRACVPFRHIREARLWRGSVDLEEAPQGRLFLEASWTPLIAAGGIS